MRGRRPEVAAARPSVLLYDWDDTLADGWLAITAALNAAFAAFGMADWSVQQTRERVRISMRDAFPVMFGADWHRARDIFYATLTREHLRHVAPMPGAAVLLDAGAAWPQGVVSNKTARFLRAEIAHLGWAARFAAVVGAGEAAADKPDPAPILLALSRLGRTADRSIWYLGDNSSDMVAARAAGVSAVLLGDAAHDGGIDRASLDFHFETPQSLAATLRALA